MVKVLFKSWKIGLKKVSLTKYIQKELDLSLNKAKELTDALLDDKSFIIQLKNIEQAKDFVKKATDLGTVCEIIKEDD